MVIFVFVKDKSTGRVVLKGTLKDGLYRLNGASPKVLHISSSVLSENKSPSTVLAKPSVMPEVNLVVSKRVWHRRLGHPTPTIEAFYIRQVAHTNASPVS